MEKNINVIMNELNKLEDEKKKLEQEREQLKNENAALFQELQVVRPVPLSLEEMQEITQKIYNNRIPLEEKEALLKETEIQIEKWNHMKENALEGIKNIDKNEIAATEKELKDIEKELKEVKLKDPNSYVIEVLNNAKKVSEEKLEKAKKEKEAYFNSEPVEGKEPIPEEKEPIPEEKEPTPEEKEPTPEEKAFQAIIDAAKAETLAGKVKAKASKIGTATADLAKKAADKMKSKNKSKLLKTIVIAGTAALAIVTGGALLGMTAVGSLGTAGAIGVGAYGYNQYQKGKKM